MIPRPSAYKADALPLSYRGTYYIMRFGLKSFVYNLLILFLIRLKMETKFIDIHAHISDRTFDADRDVLMSELGDYIILNSGEYPEENEKILDISQKYPNLLPCIGLHPNFIAMYGNARREEGFEYLFRNINRAFAVSEIGLDFKAKDEQQKEAQKGMLISILELAEKYNKVCVVHSRNAMSSLLEIIPTFKVRIILHNFEGNAHEHEKALDIGAFISISTSIMRYKREGFLRKLHPDRIFVETDSPVLSPDNNRNTPLNIPKLLDYMASVRNTDAIALKDQIYSNFKNLFYG